MTLSSITLVKNGMPFIGKVLKQVAPYMKDMVITISENSNDGTLKEIYRELEEYKDKIKLDFENVASPGALTQIENRQLTMTDSDWILFLSDDDYWKREDLELCLKAIESPYNQDYLAYSVSPYQLLDFEHYDASWDKKSFSKFLKRDGLQFIRPWPKDLPADKWGEPLYHKTHLKVHRLPYRFYHLSYLKNHSFRTEEWAIKYRFKKGSAVPLNKPLVI